MARYYTFYIEQAATTKGLWQPLIEGGSDDRTAVQNAIASKVLSTGDRDPTHYPVLKGASLITPVAQVAEFTI